MSLLDQWTIDKTNMNTALNKSDNIHGGSDAPDTPTGDADYLESLMKTSTKNQWKCTKYPYQGNNGNTSPGADWLRYYLCTANMYRNQDTSQNWSWGDDYTGTRECWIYMTNDYTLSTTLWTDDAGSIFLNGSQVTTSTSCTNKSVTLYLKKGLNHIVIAFSEHVGGDGCYITTNPFTISYCKWGYAEFDATKI